MKRNEKVMKTLKYVVFVTMLLAMLLLGCQIGRNIMVTKTSASYTGKGVKDPTAMIKQIDDFIAEVDRKGSVDVAKLKELLMAMREFISEYAKNNNIATDPPDGEAGTQRSTK